MKILLVGGGTLGSVAPLLAISERLSAADLLWIGSAAGPEKKLVAAANIKFKTIPAGKFRRYWSWHNLLDFLKIGAGYFKSLVICLRWQPRLIVGAGSYLQVPLIWAAGTLNLFAPLSKHKINIIIHQQDIVPGLANRLSARVADKITVATRKSLTDFPENKTIWTGNPFRTSILSGNVATARQRFHLRATLPVLLVLGGGSGARAINELIKKNLGALSKICEIIHLTGIDKMALPAPLPATYHAYELLISDLAHAYAVADLVITRAGFSTLTELTALQKTLVIVPLPESHQQANAAYWLERHAAVILNQSRLSDELLIQTVTELFANHEKRFDLARNARDLLPADATNRWLRVLAELMDPAIRVTKWIQN